MDPLQRIPGDGTETKIEMIQCVPGRVRRVEDRPLGVPIQLDQPARVRIAQQHPETPSPNPGVTPLHNPETEGLGVEADRAVEVLDSQTGAVEPHT